MREAASTRQWHGRALAAAVVVAAALIVVLRRLLVIIEVTTGSMSPTLEPSDRALVWRVGGTRVRRGDILLARLPPAAYGSVPSSASDDPASGELPPHSPSSVRDVADDAVAELPELEDLFVKRVVGLPGEAIYLDDLRRRLPAERRLPAGTPDGWWVPPGSVFLVGDGIESADSLSWGALPLCLVNGRVIAIRSHREGARWVRVHRSRDGADRPAPV